MNKENIPVITDREKLYDKCENMEQLFDKYYLPLLDKHYSKTYELQQQNKKYKEVIYKLKTNIKNDIDGFRTINEFGESKEILELLDIYLDILKEVSE